jgi:signal transduction histidine kinase
MRERVHLVHGRFSIESQPRKGTGVLAVVPLIVETQGSANDRGIESKSVSQGDVK